MIGEIEIIAFKEAIEIKHQVSLMGKSRVTDESAARSAFIAAVMRNLNVSLTHLARALGISHATVIHHRRNYETNYRNINCDYNNIYRFWYDIFSVDAINYKTIVADYCRSKNKAEVEMLLGYNLGRIESTRARLGR